MSFSREAVRELSVDVSVVTLLSRLRMRFKSVAVDVEDEDDVLGDPANLILALEDEGRPFVGEALELDNSFPIDANSACNADSADASAFFSFWIRSRNFAQLVSLHSTTELR